MTIRGASGVFRRVEARRLIARLTQAEVSAELGLTQGHYSKLVRGHVPAGAKAEARAEAWLAVAASSSTLEKQQQALLARAIGNSASLAKDLKELARTMRKTGQKV